MAKRRRNKKSRIAQAVSESVQTITNKEQLEHEVKRVQKFDSEGDCSLGKIYEALVKGSLKSLYKDSFSGFQREYFPHIPMETLRDRLHRAYREMEHFGEHCIGMTSANAWRAATSKRNDDEVEEIVDHFKEEYGSDEEACRNFTRPNVETVIKELFGGDTAENVNEQAKSEKSDLVDKDETHPSPEKTSDDGGFEEPEKEENPSTPLSKDAPEPVKRKFELKRHLNAELDKFDASISFTKHLFSSITLVLPKQSIKLLTKRLNGHVKTLSPKTTRRKIRTKRTKKRSIRR